jgi:hypothetical protein
MHERIDERIESSKEWTYGRKYLPLNNIKIYMKKIGCHELACIYSVVSPLFHNIVSISSSV